MADALDEAGEHRRAALQRYLVTLPLADAVPEDRLTDWVSWWLDQPIDWTYEDTPDDEEDETAVYHTIEWHAELCVHVVRFSWIPVPNSQEHDRYRLILADQDEILTPYRLLHHMELPT